MPIQYPLITFRECTQSFMPQGNQSAVDFFTNF